jgi:hypothetical protein
VSKLIRSRMTRLSAVLATAAVSMGLIAGPAGAQANNQQGLVNINLQDVTVQVPVSVAAGICGVNVAVLAQDLGQDGRANCPADADSVATRGSRQ